VQSAFAWLRRGGGATALVVANLTPDPRVEYRVGVPFAGRWRERINSDAAAYAGSGVGNAGSIESSPLAMHGMAQSIALTLPPLAAIVLTPDPDQK
jgi:1,4-alpha-glucan branching enzyme